MSCQLSAIIGGLTGDCSNTNSGAFTIDIVNGAPGYTVTWINPPYGSFPTPSDFTVTSLSAGTYSLMITDSCVPVNESVVVNVNISSGTCVSITNVQNTSCGLENGGITATTSNFYGTGTFYLYETTLGFISSASTLNDFYGFDNLPSGIYYVVADDGGGCTGKTESCMVLDSESLDLGLFVVRASSCAPNTGAIYVTGATGVPPYTYLWGPGGQTTSSITGLTVGSYTLTVTDSQGCIQSSGVTITAEPPVGLTNISYTNPSCFSSDGTVTVQVSGGTAPYQYVGSNGQIDTTFSTSDTFYNLPAGPFTVIVKDAGNCSFTASTTLLTPGGLSVTSVNVTNSTCSGNGGSINVNIFGGSPPYTYTLVDSLGSTTVVNGTFTNWTFNGLTSGVYTLLISDSGPCVFKHEYIVENNVLFELDIETTGTTCNQDNGEVLLTITPGGTPPFHYEIDGYSVFSNDLFYSFTNLTSGNYTATVTDANYCQQQLPFTITDSGTVDFLLIGSDSLNGSNGTISALLTDGTPPFTLTWSSNVNGQTGTEINSLSAGTYTLTVTDANGCSKTRTITINGFNQLSSYQVYNICDEDFTDTGRTGRKGPQEMLIEGFHDLTIGDTNCILNMAIFTVKTTVNGDVKTQTFYTGTTLTDFPSDNEFYDVVENLLLTYDVIGEVIIDAVKNSLKIESGCDITIETLDATVKVELDIAYDISCETCDNKTCNCYEISGPKGCRIGYTSCDGTQKTFVTTGIENGRICASEIITSECGECTTPLDYFFNSLNTTYETYLLDIPLGNPLGAEPAFSYGELLTTFLSRGLVITNASEVVCCSECKLDNTNFYMLSGLYTGFDTYDFIGEFPTCCNNYTGDTSGMDYFMDGMIGSFGEVPPQCVSEFSNCLGDLETLIGTPLYTELFEKFGFLENPLSEYQTLMCSLVFQMNYLMGHFGFTASDVADIITIILDFGFTSVCKNDTVFIGNARAFTTYFDLTYDIVLPDAICDPLTINNITECVNNLCPTQTACTSPMEYLFSIIPLPILGPMGAEPTPVATYIENMTTILKDGILLNIDDYDFCCPTSCEFVTLDTSFSANVYFLGQFKPFGNITKSKNGLGMPTCCINHAFNVEEYASYINSYDIGSLNFPVACCNSFEPCIEYGFNTLPPTRGFIEFSTINGKSELCNLINSIDNLPFTDLEKSDIADSLLSQGFNVWCYDGNILISNTDTFLETYNSL